MLRKFHSFFTSPTVVLVVLLSSTNSVNAQLGEALNLLNTLKGVSDILKIGEEQKPKQDGVSNVHNRQPEGTQIKNEQVPVDSRMKGLEFLIDKKYGTIEACKENLGRTWTSIRGDKISSRTERFENGRVTITEHSTSVNSVRESPAGLVVEVVEERFVSGETSTFEMVYIFQTDSYYVSSMKLISRLSGRTIDKREEILVTEGTVKSTGKRVDTIYWCVPEVIARAESEKKNFEAEEQARKIKEAREAELAKERKRVEDKATRTAEDQRIAKSQELVAEKFKKESETKWTSKINNDKMSGKNEHFLTATKRAGMVLVQNKMFCVNGSLNSEIMITGADFQKFIPALAGNDLRTLGLSFACAHAPSTKWAIEGRVRYNDVLDSKWYCGSDQYNNVVSLTIGKAENGLVSTQIKSRRLILYGLTQEVIAANGASFIFELPFRDPLVVGLLQSCERDVN